MTPKTQELDKTLTELFEKVKEIEKKLRPFKQIIDATFPKPLAEMGVMDKIKVAQFILGLNKLT